MKPAVALIAFLSASVQAVIQQPGKRQAAATNDAVFSSAAAQLISLYIPPSAASALQSAASAGGVTGDLNAAVQSAFTATVTPSWLSAAPSQYQTNVVALESAVEALRGAASTGIPGAPRVTTSTDSAGSAIVSTVPGSSVATASLPSGIVTIQTISPTGGAPIVIVASSGGSSGSNGGSAMSGSATTTTTVTSSASSAASSSSASRSSASSSSAARSSSASAASTSARPSSSSGLGAPTQAPVVAAGVLGLLGVAAML